jgi:hypothetical protein
MVHFFMPCSTSEWLPAIPERNDYKEKQPQMQKKMALADF